MAAPGYSSTIVNSSTCTHGAARRSSPERRSPCCYLLPCCHGTRHAGCSAFASPSPPGSSRLSRTTEPAAAAPGGVRPARPQKDGARAGSGSSVHSKDESDWRAIECLDTYKDMWKALNVDERLLVHQLARGKFANPENCTHHRAPVTPRLSEAATLATHRRGRIRGVCTNGRERKAIRRTGNAPPREIYGPAYAFPCSSSW